MSCLLRLSFVARLLGIMTLTLLSIALAGCSTAPRPASETIDLTASMEGLDATFVVRDLATGRTRIHNPARAATGFTPASTFKIPNSMIGLETGILDGAEAPMAWDQTRDPAQEHWSDAWKRDQTLRTAFENSVVWYYRELARRIGAERMQAWLDRLNYGNRDMRGGLDLFWLRGAIRISALEQVDFLERFLRGTLPISERTTAIMRDIMLIEETSGATGGYRLSGKTGTFVAAEGAPPEPQLGWLVGYVERGDRTTIFALNISGDRIWEDYPRPKRIELARTLLRGLDILPPAR